jgi:hypothetical protein
MIYMSKGDQHIKTLFQLWEQGVIHKYDFYVETMPYHISRIARITGIEYGIIKDRRDYMNELGRQMRAARERNN